MGCSKSSSKMEVFSNTGLPQETIKIHITDPILHLKKLEKEKKAKLQVKRK